MFYLSLSLSDVSEDSGWTKPGDGIATGLLGYMPSDWPVMTSCVIANSLTGGAGSVESPNSNNSGSGIIMEATTNTILPQDNLQTVLEKLELGKYYHIFQVYSFTVYRHAYDCAMF